MFLYHRIIGILISYFKNRKCSHHNLDRGLQIKYKMIVDDDNLKYNSFEILWGMGDEQSQENRSSRTVY